VCVCTVQYSGQYVCLWGTVVWTLCVFRVLFNSVDSMCVSVRYNRVDSMCVSVRYNSVDSMCVSVRYNSVDSMCVSVRYNRVDSMCVTDCPQSLAVCAGYVVTEREGKCGYGTVWNY
jgi:hypothetical protein